MNNWMNDWQTLRLVIKNVQMDQFYMEHLNTKILNLGPDIFLSVHNII